MPHSLLPAARPHAEAPGIQTGMLSNSASIASSAS